MSTHHPYEIYLICSWPEGRTPSPAARLRSPLMEEKHAGGKLFSGREPVQPCVSVISSAAPAAVKRARRADDGVFGSGRKIKTSSSDQVGGDAFSWVGGRRPCWPELVWGASSLCLMEDLTAPVAPWWLTAVQLVNPSVLADGTGTKLKTKVHLQ